LIIILDLIFSIDATFPPESESASRGSLGRDNEIGDPSDDQETRVVTDSASMFEYRPCNTVGLHIHGDRVRVLVHDLPLLVVTGVAVHLLACHQTPDDDFRCCAQLGWSDRDCFRPWCTSYRLNVAIAHADRRLIESYVTTEIALGRELPKLAIVQITGHYDVSNVHFISSCNPPSDPDQDENLGPIVLKHLPCGPHGWYLRSIRRTPQDNGEIIFVPTVIRRISQTVSKPDGLTDGIELLVDNGKHCDPRCSEATFSHPTTAPGWYNGTD